MREEEPKKQGEKSGRLDSVRSGPSRGASSIGAGRRKREADALQSQDKHGRASRRSASRGSGFVRGLVSGAKSRDRVGEGQGFSRSSARGASGGDEPSRAGRVRTSEDQASMSKGRAGLSKSARAGQHSGAGAGAERRSGRGATGNRASTGNRVSTGGRAGADRRADGRLSSARATTVKGRGQRSLSSSQGASFADEARVSSGHSSRVKGERSSGPRAVGGRGDFSRGRRKVSASRGVRHSSASSRGLSGTQGRRMSAAAQARARAQERSEIRVQRQHAALIVVLVCLFLAGIFLGVTYIRGNLKRHSESVTVVPTNLYTPVACSPSMLQSTVQADDGRAGSPVNIVVTLRNSSADNPCYINVGSANMKVNITSGDAQVSDVSACGSWDESKILLLNREMTTTYTVSWNGGGAASGCGSAGNLAAPGTYVATVSFADGTAAQAVDSFVLR